jgi:hypothetical protein
VKAGKSLSEVSFERYWVGQVKEVREQRFVSDGDCEEKGGKSGQK